MWKYAVVIGCIVLVGCILYARSNARITVEGLENNTNPQEAEKLVLASSQAERDDINLANYRKNFEEIILESELWAQRKRVGILKKNFTKSPELVTQFNELSTFIGNLNDVLSWLDKN